MLFSNKTMRTCGMNEMPVNHRNPFEVKSSR